MSCSLAFIPNYVVVQAQTVLDSVTPPFQYIIEAVLNKFKLKYIQMNTCFCFVLE
jgi:hypothetical protein